MRRNTSTATATACTSSPLRKPYSELKITAAGEVETSDTGGVLGDLGETANPQLFLRPTTLTTSSEGIDAVAEGIRARGTLDKLHHLLEQIAGPRRLRHRVDRQPRPAPRKPSRRARGSARTTPTSSSRRHESSEFRPATSPATCIWKANGRRSPTTPGRRPIFAISAGSASTRLTISARRSAMCASPVVLMRLPRRRSPGRAGAGASESLAVDVVVRQQQQ